MSTQDKLLHVLKAQLLIESLEFFEILSKIENQLKFSNYSIGNVYTPVLKNLFRLKRDIKGDK